jgi:hypothetical protein
MNIHMLTDFAETHRGEDGTGLTHIYLDDERPTPEAWTRFYTALHTVCAIQANLDTLQVISLDHDLGDDDVHGTGYDVVNWIENEIHTNPDFAARFKAEIRIHSANAVGRQNIQRGIDSIQRFQGKL